MTEKKIWRYHEGRKREEVIDSVTIEAPLTIYLNGEELITLLCTPKKTDRLALGFLRSEGLISALNDVSSLRVDEKKGLVEIELKNDKVLAGKLFGRRMITSGCGKGTVFYNALDSVLGSPVTGKLQITPEQVRLLMDELQSKGDLFRLTGGTHIAAMAECRRLLITFEDIGRHNALDKIIGESLLQGITAEDKIIVSSGRISSEILLKAAKLKIQLLISRAAPTSLSVNLAEKLNITLIGFVRGKRFNVYTHEWRISED
ncbi:MAG: formate dehydrogenase accessory sulfurtransferase FdhD [Bacillota bacterium]|nr:formate dehydrogenase accessory sulfurtransferase FdhD [Bacillota bacterium]